MVTSELEVRRGMLEFAIKELVEPVSPVGMAHLRKAGFNTPSSIIERWTRKFPQNSLMTEMLVDSSARIVVATSEEYQQKPWLGLKIWAKPVNHSPLKQVTMTLYYHSEGLTAERWYQLALIEDQKPLIRLGGIKDSRYGRSYLKTQGLDAGLEDFELFHKIITNQR